MISQENFYYTIRNLKARKLRSSLTIFSIFIGIAAVFIFVSFGFGLYSYVEDFSSTIGVDKIIVQAKGVGGPGTDPTFKLTDTDLSTLRKVRGVQDVAGMYYSALPVKFRDEDSFQFIIGYSLDSDQEAALVREFFNPTLIEGRDLRKSDVNNIVLGYSYSKDTLYSSRVKLGDRIEINGQRFRVVGFYDSYGNPPDDGNVYMTEETFKRFIDQDASYAMILGRVDINQELDTIIARAEKSLRNSRGVEEGKEDFFIQTPAELIEQFKLVLNIIIFFVIAIAFISVIVSAINTANTMITSVIERTQEIGVIKSIGAKNIEIFNIFVLESAILGFVAGVIGAVLGFGVSQLVAFVLRSIGFGAIQPAFPALLFVGCILFATIIGIISGVAPALNASKQKPVDALRYD